MNYYAAVQIFNSAPTQSLSLNNTKYILKTFFYKPSLCAPC